MSISNEIFFQNVTILCSSRIKTDSFDLKLFIFLMHETISYLYCGITDSKEKSDHQKNLCCIEVIIDRDEIKVKIPQCVGGNWVRISNFI